MKVVAFCGSGRKESNTKLLLESVLKPLADAGADTEIIELAGNEIIGCMACYVCFLEKDRTCVLKKDIINNCLLKWLQQMPLFLVHQHTFPISQVR